MSSIEPHLPHARNLDRDWSAYLPNIDHTRRDLRMAIPRGPGGLYHSGEYFGKEPARLGVEVASISSQLADRITRTTLPSGRFPAS